MCIRDRCKTSKVFYFLIKQSSTHARNGRHFFYCPLMGKILTQCLLELHEYFRKVSCTIILFCKVPCYCDKQLVNKLIRSRSITNFLVKNFIMYIPKYSSGL